MRPLPFFLFLCLSLVACQSAGQQEKKVDKGGGWRRPPVPDSILAALPALPDSVLQTAHFQFLAHGEIASEAVQTYADTCEAMAERIIRFLGKKEKTPRIDCHLYTSIQDKGLLLKDSRPSQADFEKNTAHSVLGDAFTGERGLAENSLLIKAILGHPKTEILRCGLVIYFTNNWQRRGYGQWAATLFESESLPILPDLLNPDRRESCSDLILGSSAASFTAFLINKWGREAFLKKYADWSPSPEEMQVLETGWLSFIEEQAAFFPSEKWTPQTAETPFLKGFNFAHEGYGMYNGYGSKQAAGALVAMSGLGANTAAIVPYTFMRDPTMPSTIPVAKHSGSETDESVIQSAWDAKKLGMTVVLKPQIWIGGGFWPGDIEMKSEQDWQFFFQNYSHWITHYAMMAEIHGMDMLCIGTEMVKTTLLRETDWRVLIKKIRGIYHGKLVYAANWGEEFEKITLWDDLDFIGLNCYYPLSKKDNPSDRELKKGFEDIVKKIEKIQERFHKPLIFTEIGFPSSEMPWKDPHVDRNGAPFNSEHQERCYEAVFECLQNKPWYKGILWWKFPSTMDRHGPEHTGFSPYNKTAEEVVKKWFKEM